MRRTPVVAFLCSCALAFAACSGVASAPPVRVEGRPVTPTPIPMAVHPLTGESFQSPADWQERQVIAAKIGNSSLERPQSGLEDADLIYEELAEGGITRFIAVFHSTDPGLIGPVRSARLVDAEIIGPLKPLFAYAGGVAPVITSVRSDKRITDVSFDNATDAYTRLRDREAPYNLYADVSDLWNNSKGGPPIQLFHWLEASVSISEGGAVARSVDFSFADNNRSSFRYSDGRWLRSNNGRDHILNNGSTASPVNVLVQYVSTKQGSIVDRNGERSPDTSVAGTGEALLFRGGRVFEGRWETQPSGLTNFVLADGSPMLLAPGQTYVELIPKGRHVKVNAE